MIEAAIFIPGKKSDFELSKESNALLVRGRPELTIYDLRCGYGELSCIFYTLYHDYVILSKD